VDTFPAETPKSVHGLASIAKVSSSDHVGAKGRVS
jgi:hypothetical protein